MDLACNMSCTLSETRAAWVSLTMLEAERHIMVIRATRPARATKVAVLENVPAPKESTINFMR